MSERSCNCFVARHPQAAEINAALRGGEDPRTVAVRFAVGKSKAYEHRKHLLGEVAPPRAAPEAVPPAVERSAELVERRMESGGTPVAAPVISPRALPAKATVVPSGAYASAVTEAVQLITDGAWRAGHVEVFVEKHGLARNSARAAHAEAVRHLQMNMGDFVARQAVSAAYVTAQRDEAKAESRRAKEHAERWRKQEREAQEEADKLEGKERFAALETAARFGLLATKYDLSAEKWSAQALAHQRHLDEVLCLRSPKVNATQINLGGDGSAKLEEFARSLATRFRDRPDILAELDAAAEAIEQGRAPGDAEAIVTTAEAA